jgi:hypothetical protein
MVNILVTRGRDPQTTSAVVKGQAREKAAAVMAMAVIKAMGLRMAKSTI